MNPKLNISADWSNDEPRIGDAHITYYQGPDCNDGEDNVQAISFKTENNGSGIFVRMYVGENPKECWSFDNFADLIKLFQDFCHRVGLNFQEYCNFDDDDGKVQPPQQMLFS